MGVDRCDSRDVARFLDLGADSLGLPSRTTTAVLCARHPSSMSSVARSHRLGGDKEVPAGDTGCLVMNDITPALAPMPDDQWLTDRELAKWLGLSQAKLKKDRKRKIGLPAHKIGRSVRYRVGEVRAWLDAHA